MPTPSETTIPPTQQPEDAAQPPHLSCPPEEMRDGPSQHISHNVALQRILDEQADQLRDVMTQQAQLEEDVPQADTGAADTEPSPEPQEKEDDEEMLEEEGDIELTPSTTSSFLRPGSKFHGTQQSDRQVYDVQVEIKDVNMAESFLCGYLRIQGLTDNHPTLTTFFEGEIISPKHLFKTPHPSWGATEKIDLQHWARFPAWKPLARTAKHSGAAFSLPDYQEREHLFMRWKEYFLVPDHRVRTITGASFEGFYYICFNQVRGTVSGIYFHSKSERYQQLELEVVEDRGCVGAMEFR